MRSYDTPLKAKDRRTALQMADAILFLANVATRAGLTAIRTQLFALHRELLGLGLSVSPEEPAPPRRKARPRSLQ